MRVFALVTTLGTLCAKGRLVKIDGTAYGAGSEVDERAEILPLLKRLRAEALQVHANRMPRSVVPPAAFSNEAVPIMLRQAPARGGARMVGTLGDESKSGEEVKEVDVGERAELLEPTIEAIAAEEVLAEAKAPMAAEVVEEVAPVEEADSPQAEELAAKEPEELIEQLARVVVVNAPLRKRDRPRQLFRQVKGLVGLGRSVREAADELIDDSCDIEEQEVCEDPEERKEVAAALRGLIGRTMRFDLGRPSRKDLEDGEGLEVLEDLAAEGAGEAMEEGWAARGQQSALKRTLEVWGFGARSAFRVLKARKAKGTEEERSAAKTAAAEYIRDGLFRLGPTFVKFGQVLSTRSDVVPKEYIEVLKDLQDNVPGFGGDRAVQIIEKEFGRPIGEIFDDFTKEPLAAASLGQVHRATYKGKLVAVKVQRAGLKELFDTDLKNLKVFSKLLDRFDPKADGADRSYCDIYDESAKLLYEEIDYTLEAANAKRFKQAFADIGVDYIRVPKCYAELTNPRVLTMEYLDAYKMTDLAKMEDLGLDKQQLTDRIATSFLAQILKTSYFHCDPHPGNLQCDRQGNLVFFDCGMMNELQPNVASGFKEACFALFGGGPFISQIQLDAAGKRLVDALQSAGVLAKGADRLAVEKLARYFIRTFKDIQLGKAPADIKQTLGADLQKLNEEQVFRFPSTFTFIFRAFASVDGIAKGLDKDFDISKAAQPFIEGLKPDGAPETDFEVFIDRFGKATGLNTGDVNTALTQPRKVAYIEETVRSMEQGTLKIRVRSLENEQALTRLALVTQVNQKLLLAVLFLNLGLTGAWPRAAAGAFLSLGGLFGAQAAGAGLSVKKFDKTAAKYESKDFVG